MFFAECETGWFVGFVIDSSALGGSELVGHKLEDLGFDLLVMLVTGKEDRSGVAPVSEAAESAPHPYQQPVQRYEQQREVSNGAGFPKQKWAASHHAVGQPPHGHLPRSR